MNEKIRILGVCGVSGIIAALVLFYGERHFGGEADFPAFQDPARDPKLVLTVSESIGSIFANCPPTEYLATCKYANPGVKPYLYKILGDESISKYYHRRIWLILGYIGSDSDAVQLEKSLRNELSKKPSSVDDMAAITGKFEALGLMCGRRVRAAQDIADKMAKADYWRELSVRFYPGKTPGQLSAEYEALYQFMIGYSLSRNSDVGKLWEQVLEETENADDRKLIEPVAHQQTWIEYAETWRKNEDAPITPELRKKLAACFNGDFQHPGPVDPALRGDSLDRAERGDQERFLAELRKLGGRQTAGHSMSVVGMDLSGTDINDGHLALLKALPKLSDLNVARTQITDEGLEHLKGIRELRSLNLAGTNITDAGLAYLRGLDQLRVLYLDHSNVEGAGLSQLRGSRLQTLSLGGMKITDKGLEVLSGLDDLKDLYLHESPLTNAGLAHLEGCIGLRYLLLECPRITDEGLLFLKDLRNLEVLAIHRAPITDDGFTHLESLTNLRSWALCAKTLPGAPMPKMAAPASSGNSVTRAAIWPKKVPF